jgi:REP element-mobilizing transposase RayT
MSLYLLTPCKVVNQIMEYCVARAAGAYGILIDAVSVESNHFHLVVTDARGCLSDFMQELNRSAARCLLEHYRARNWNRFAEGILRQPPALMLPILLSFQPERTVAPRIPSTRRFASGIQG